MIEPPKLNSEKLSNVLERHPTRLKRELELKEKIATIVKDHPNKSVRVIRRWLRDDPN
ncbi:hypothetical protein V5T82_14895 [Magnetovibrio sp. PR-2]|uniref:hypothetical protein n=1 Tax=Magnetovibrio sp. PR-2 TaxID=3120356 RepID=UPI002FCE14C8